MQLLLEWKNGNGKEEMAIIDSQTEYSIKSSLNFQFWSFYLDWPLFRLPFISNQ